MTRRESGRRSASTTVKIGSMGEVSVDTSGEHIAHMGGEVDIEVSGSALADGDDVWDLTKAIEKAVVETVDEYEATDEVSK